MAIPLKSRTKKRVGPKKLAKVRKIAPKRPVVKKPIEEVEKRRIPLKRTRTGSISSIKPVMKWTESAFIINNRKFKSSGKRPPGVSQRGAVRLQAHRELVTEINTGMGDLIRAAGKLRRAA